MISQLKSRAVFGAAAALVSAIFGAAPNAAQASFLNISDTEIVNGQPCNDYCKAYLAWSDRVRTMIQPSQARSQVNVAQSQKKIDRPEKPERVAHQQPKPRRQPLNSFAQLPAGSHLARAAMDAPQPDAMAAEPAGTGMGRLSGEGMMPPTLADFRGSMAEPDTRRVAMTETASADEPRTVGAARAFNAPSTRLISFLLALGALLAYFAWGWLKQRAREAEHAIR